MSRWIARLSPVAASVLAVALAGPASATDEYTQNAVGTYEVRYPWGDYTWVVTPCKDEANKCINVTEFSGNDTGLAPPRWSADAYWTVGSWITAPAALPDEIVCGEKHTLVFTYAWDAVSNKGWRSYRDPAICGGGKESSGTQPFTLVKKQVSAASDPW